MKHLQFWEHLQNCENGQEQESWDYLSSQSPKKKEEEQEKRCFPTDQKEAWHFHPIAFVEQMMRMLGKPDVDLRPLMTFINQNPTLASCNQTCRAMLKQLNLTPYGASKTMQLGYETANSIDMIEGETEKAVKYIDAALEYGHPVMVGVDHTFEYR